MRCGSDLATARIQFVLMMG